MIQCSIMIRLSPVAAAAVYAIRRLHVLASGQSLIRIYTAHIHAPEHCLYIISCFVAVIATA